MPGPRRASGATHSFRLSRTSADMVDRLPPFVSLEGRPYPRSLGGKSKLVSDAILWCYGSDGARESYHDLQISRAWWVQHCEEIKEAQISGPLPPPSEQHLDPDRPVDRPDPPIIGEIFQISASADGDRFRFAEEVLPVSMPNDRSLAVGIRSHASMS